MRCEWYITIARPGPVTPPDGPDWQLFRVLGPLEPFATEFNHGAPATAWILWQRLVAEE